MKCSEGLRSFSRSTAIRKAAYAKPPAPEMSLVLDTVESRFAIGGFRRQRVRAPDALDRPAPPPPPPSAPLPPRILVQPPGRTAGGGVGVREVAPAVLPVAVPPVAVPGLLV